VGAASDTYVGEHGISEGGQAIPAAVAIQVFIYTLYKWPLPLVLVLVMVLVPLVLLMLILYSHWVYHLLSSRYVLRKQIWDHLSAERYHTFFFMKTQIPMRESQELLKQSRSEELTEQQKS